MLIHDLKFDINKKKKSKIYVFYRINHVFEEEKQKWHVWTGLYLKDLNICLVDVNSNSNAIENKWNAEKYS